MDRRTFLTVGVPRVVVGVAGCVGLLGCGQNRPNESLPAGQKEHEEGVSVPEYLMREHGVLRRVLLAYQECIRRVEAGQDLSPGVVKDSAEIIRTFIEQYHEKLEEDHLFPRFEKAGAMAKRTRIPHAEFAELVSEGNMALLRSVEKFDVSRGFKFSTYACRAILKSFNRLATNTGRYRQRFPMEFDPQLERSDYDVHRHQIQRDDSVDALREVLARNRASLNDVERTVVVERFAIGTGGKGRTLSEIGKLVGLTNERVRQIQNIALAKIRTVLDERFLVA